MNTKNDGYLSVDHLERQQDEEINTVDGEIKYLKATQRQLEKWGFYKLAARIQKEIEELGSSEQ